MCAFVMIKVREEGEMHYDIFVIAQMILDAIIVLDDNEYTYYCDILGF